MIHAANDARMISDQSLLRESEIHQPAILTLAIRTRLATINSACRELRKMGLRIVDQDVAPNDDGHPVVHVGTILPSMADQLISIAGGSTQNTDLQICSATVYGVRVVWGIPQ